MWVCVGDKRLVCAILARTHTQTKSNHYTVFKAIFIPKFGFEVMTFDPHLHMEDGVILTRSSIEICLVDQGPYTHKISKHLDK